MNHKYETEKLFVLVIVARQALPFEEKVLCIFLNKKLIEAQHISKLILTYEKKQINAHICVTLIVAVRKSFIPLFKNTRKIYEIRSIMICDTTLKICQGNIQLVLHYYT